jgi:hypothetical protein
MNVTLYLTDYNLREVKSSGYDRLTRDFVFPHSCQQRQTLSDGLGVPSAAVQSLAPVADCRNAVIGEALYDS